MAEASRRTVLTAAGLGAVAAAVLPGGAAAAAVSRTVPQRSAWVAALGKRVVLRDARTGARVPARVREVGDLAGSAAGHPLRYSVFVEPEAPLADGLHRVSGQGLPASDLGFINIGPDRVALQAVVDAVPR